MNPCASALLVLALLPQRCPRRASVHPRATQPVLCRQPRVDIERATGSSLHEAAEFFVEAFWLSSTTYGTVKVSERERRALAGQMADDLEQRYGTSWGKRSASGGRLFPARLLLARDDTSGAIVGCVGIEAALLNPLEGGIIGSAGADALLRMEIALMLPSEQARTSAAFEVGGLTALCAELLPEYTAVGLLTNLAVAPSARRQGLGGLLCEYCDAGCAEWALMGTALQVEESNAAARALYERAGFDEIRRESNASALRLQPGAASAVSALLLTSANDELLQNVPSTLVTMAKAASARRAAAAGSEGSSTAGAAERQGQQSRSTSTSGQDSIRS